MRTQYNLVPREPVPQQQTVNYFEAVRGPLRAINDGVLGKATSSLGQAVVATTPISMAAKMLRQRKYHTMNGVGQADGFRDLGLVAGVLVVTYVVVTGALSYQAGKAMAPNRGDRSTWGWVGVPVGILTGPWGLGVMGIVSNSRKG